MADAVDAAQKVTDSLVAEGLRRQQLEAAARLPGLSHCVRDDCREPIAQERQRLGGRYCEDCQREVDIRAAQYARGRV